MKEDYTKGWKIIYVSNCYECPYCIKESCSTYEGRQYWFDCGELDRKRINKRYVKKYILKDCPLQDE